MTRRGGGHLYCFHVFVCDCFITAGVTSCHDLDCDYGRQSLTLAMQNFSIWTSFPQISIEMGLEMGNIFGMYICYSPALVDPYWEKLPEVLSTTLGRRPREVLRPRAQFLENFTSASNLCMLK